MRLSEILEIPELGLRPLVGEGRLDRDVRWVFTTDLPDPGRYLVGGDLVLTGLVWYHGRADAETFVAALARGGVAALGAGDAALGSVPDDLVRACRRHGVPLFEVPVETSFATITDLVTRRLTAERTARLSSTLGQHRRLLSAVAEGGDLADVFEVAAAGLDMPCWVLSSLGRVVAGTTPPPTPDQAARLALAFLAARQLPESVQVAGHTYTIFLAAPRPVARVVGWFLACEGDQRVEDGREIALELAALAALEHGRTQAERRAGRRVAAELLFPVTAAPLTGVDDAEAARRLRAAGRTEDLLVAVSSAIDAPSELAGVACGVLEEAVHALGTQGTFVDIDGEALALVPVSAEGKDPLAEHLSGALGILEHGLGDARLDVGVSDPTCGAAGVRGAVEEARHARSLARRRPGRVSLVAGDELRSHLVLLASVPDEVRASFRTRLLGSLERYDAAHRSEFVRTLEAFLDCSGSWSRCAEELHVHVNTLRYRVGRIEELTGRDLGSLEDRVDFFLALRSR